MKREIYFRAFNKKTKQLCDVLLICFVNRYVNVLPEESLEGGSQEEWSFDDIVLEQFTGLYDKNGKEIYEGDKLKNPKNEVGVVVFYENGFFLECPRKDGNFFHIQLTEGFMLNKEIIGNIHENK